VCEGSRETRADVAQLVEHSLGKTLRQRSVAATRKKAVTSSVFDSGHRLQSFRSEEVGSGRADVAQLVEHSLGKGEVTSSILVIGSIV
jgi:hypothetical protein